MKTAAVPAEHSELQMLRLRAVNETCGHSISTTYRNIAAGIFPVPIELGPNRKGWPRYEVEAINRAMIAGKSLAETRAIVGALVAARKDLASKSGAEIRAFVSQLIDGRAVAA